jgi:hypothetical protein
MKSVEWKTYRTRFLVKAKQLSSSLTFIDPLGRQHSGRKGDYLVESDGMLRIAPRQIFEDIYVTISPREAKKNEADKNKAGDRNTEGDFLSDHEPMFPPRRKPAQKITRPAPSGQPLRRKLPQSFRDRRTPGSGLGVM